MLFSSKPKLIECIPNISEGRRPEVIDQLVGVIKKLPEVELLDYSSDDDHNRSVFTFLGTPKGIFQAAYDLAEMALELIDVNQWQGVHPMMGAIDVIPLVPVQNISWSEVIQLARQLGYELETHLHLPAYFYERATSEKQFQNLANLRKESHNLKKHKTGGCVSIGVRDYLIACNAILKTDQMQAAKNFAKKVREKDGGISYLKAIGVPLPSKNQVQLSMCITNPHKLKWPKLQQLITQQAQSLGVEIDYFELIGLLPEDIKQAAKQFKA